jgi:hypothetical protein
LADSDSDCQRNPRHQQHRSKIEAVVTYRFKIFLIITVILF